MKTPILIQAALLATTAVSASIASAAVGPGCIMDYTGCDKVTIQSVELVNVKSCHYNPRALAPADPGGAIQCAYNVTYLCDGKEQTNVVISPARFGCRVVRP